MTGYIFETFTNRHAENQAAILNWARFINVPSCCHGSPEKVSAWIERGGACRELSQ